MGKIKYLVMDVDGTLTDGKIYMGQEGELSKAFDVKDGAGINLVLPKLEITPIIITARESKILENRCRELNILNLFQGVRDKLEILKDIAGKDLGAVAYVGDDLPDIPCIEEVRIAGGIVMAPSDAIPEIKALANFVSGYKAGRGAIRDCINYLSQNNHNDIEKEVKSAIDCILSGKYKDGLLHDGHEYSIQEYDTKPENECILESHRKHIDIQYMIEGQEKFKIYSTDCLTSLREYDAVNDLELWQDGLVTSQSFLGPGSLVVVYNGQPHKGAILVGHKERIKKMICKIYI